MFNVAIFNAFKSIIECCGMKGNNDKTKYFML